MAATSAAPSADLASRAEALLAAHHLDRPLLLPNAWDVASARAVEAAGFFVASSSNAIAAVLGERDDDSSRPDVIFDWLARMARAVSVPLTADVQAGYGLPAKQLVERLLATGAVGCNLEDTDHHGGGGPIVSSERQAEYLAAVRAAADAHGVHLVINARVDTFVRKVGDEAAQLAEAIRRGRIAQDRGGPMRGNQRVIDALNELLTLELTVVNQYFVHSKMCENWGYARLAAKLREIAFEEMRDAEEIIDRILFLDGVPNMQRLGSVTVGETVPEQFRIALEGEHRALELLRGGISIALEEGDEASREFFAGRLLEEEGHVDFAETQLGLIEQLGEANYLAQQLTG